MSENNLPVYIVSGLPRSGTSMMMKMLEVGGLRILTDNIRTADDDNLQGYYEFERVKQLKEGDVDWLKDAGGSVVKVISALLEHLPVGQQYKVIFMEREMMEILSSQRKMLERRGKPGNPAEDGKFAELYGKHLDKIKNWLAHQTNMEILYIHYNEMVKQPVEYAAKVAEFLGAPMDVKAMGEVPQVQFYRQRK